MTSAEDAVLRGDLPLPFTLFDNQRNEYFEVSRQGDALRQSQYALDRGGKQIFRQDWKIAWIIGSGENGIGFLIQRDRYLFEAPLSYYSKSRTWSFSPGYERHNYAFTRPILAECSSCHSGRPQPVYGGGSGLYQDPPFAELAVGCENCHGPGELHVAERRAALPLKESFDNSIVNPKHLSGWLADNICMKCHQGGDVRVPQPGKHDADFRPGTQLDAVLAIFKAPLSRSINSSPDVLLEHYFSMTLSKCYRASAGNLHCTSCHDPHAEPRTTEAAAYYRNRCLQCHASQPCKAQLKGGGHDASAFEDCAACHMRKRSATTITHAALTEHRVTVTPEEALPEEAFESGAEPNSGLIHLTATPGTSGQRSSDITLFQAYATLVHEGHEQFRPRMNSMLDRLAIDSPDNPVVLSALARKAAAAGTPEALKDAKKYFEQAIQLGSKERDNFLSLAELYSRSGDDADAIHVLRQGMHENPYAPEFPESLATALIRSDDYRNAADVVRRGLDLFPDDAILRNLRGKIQFALPGVISSNDPH
jgi:tetratricopeptide (TPR) repeat protein